MPDQPFSATGLLLLLTLSVLAFPAAPATAQKATAEENAEQPFPIGFWCGPPEKFITVERYAQIRDAGFTFIMPECAGGKTPGVNRKILNTAEQVGLTAYISDARMPHSISGEPEAKAKIDAIVADYKDHPALAGYFIGDEPGADAFPALAEVVGYLREKDPEHPAYLNLYPNYAPPHALHTPDYATYVQRYIEQVKPAVVSYDHYHFMNHSDRPGFFANLETVRKLSLEAGLPFWQIVLAINHFDYRPLTEAEKRWEAMQTLAYGGKGVMYFTYWQPSDDGNWGEAIIQHDGTPTRQYEEITRINRDVQAIGRHLLNARSVAVFQHGTPGDLTNVGPAMPVRFDAPAVTVGLFRDGKTNYVLYANRDYVRKAEIDTYLHTAGQPLQKLDKTDGTWSDVPPAAGKEAKEGEVAVVLSLEPGDGKLYRWVVP